MGHKNKISMRIEWGDTDPARIVYYPQYFRWFDVAGHRLFDELGLSQNEMAKRGEAGMPIVEAHAEFKRMKSVLLLIGALGLVLFAVGSSMLARRVARPLDLLVADSDNNRILAYPPAAGPDGRGTAVRKARRFRRNGAGLRHTAYRRPATICRCRKRR